MSESTVSKDEIESRLLNIWAEALGLEDVRRDQAFMELGGDSLAAMLCISRIRNAFQIDCSLEDFLLDNLTVAEFAAMLERSINAGR